MKKTLLLATTLAFTALASAQTATTPAKKELVAKILRAQEPQLENHARALVSQPASQLLQQAGLYIQQRIPAERREETFRGVQEEAKKFFDENFPIVHEKAKKFAPSTIAPILEQQLTAAELKQVLAIYESPAWRKYQGLAVDMQRALNEKLSAELKSQFETNVRNLDAAIRSRLGVASSPASGPSNGK